MNGKIIKGIAGFYYVYADFKIYECKARGIFRKEGMKPLVGDDVEIEVLSDGKKESDNTGNIIHIHARHSKLIRPAVANVDAVLLVASVAMPKPVPLMLDKCLISFMIQGVPVSILWNKMDLLCQDEASSDETNFGESNSKDLMQAYENAGFSNLCISTQTGYGMENLRRFLEGKTTVLAGASGVGKSSLTNLLCEMASMETGNLSKKIERGKHTTRHSQFFAINAHSFLCDTPGFTFVQLDSLQKEELKQFYPEFQPFEGKCKFHGCLHIHEPDCKVKEQIGIKVDAIRYENYKKLFKEIESIRRY